MSTATHDKGSGLTKYNSHGDGIRYTKSV